MDIGTAHDMIEDLMTELAEMHSKLFLMTRYRDHYAQIAACYYNDGLSEESDEMYRRGCGEPSE